MCIYGSLNETKKNMPRSTIINNGYLIVQKKTVGNNGLLKTNVNNQQRFSNEEPWGITTINNGLLKNRCQMMKSTTVPNRKPLLIQ